YVVDGNFTAQHMNMKKPEGNVSLSDGLGYMVKNEPYRNHIASAPEHREVSALDITENFPTNRSNLQATGIGATACTRHGCFLPHSMVDFYKGEQQKNINYSICQALSYNSARIQKALIIYDVACQWYVKFAHNV
ncbi:hypothetical protein SCLCIDRAFT_77318, partial [Scleroderma citrinum Foug A]